MPTSNPDDNVGTPAVSPMELAYRMYIRLTPALLRRLLEPFVDSVDSLRLLIVYVWIGILGEIVLFGALQTLLTLHWPRIAAVSISYAVAVALQFFLNKYYNFRAFDRMILHQAGTYVIVTVVTYALTVVIVEIGVRALHLAPLLALLLTLPVGLPVAYLGNRYLTFGPGVLAGWRRLWSRLRPRRSGS